MPSTDNPLHRAITRLWQPRRPLFWLMVAFNALSSVLAWMLHLLQPTGGLLVALTLLALANVFMGWWLLSILWRESACSPLSGDPHVQSPARQQDR
jgi:uncharacterized membrane protein HdeD (DUF308 family)